MALLIKVDGTIEHVAPQDSKKGFTIAEIYKHIGGGCDMFQFVPLRGMGLPGFLCDEEGKLRQPPQVFNEVATQRFKAHLLPGDWLAGNILVLEKKSELK